jgi:hypothetical protein
MIIGKLADVAAKGLAYQMMTDMVTRSACRSICRPASSRKQTCTPW